jgi:type-F conjugative transfer system pilin assembly protein TrbC
LEKTELLFGLDLLYYQHLKYKQTQLVCVKAKHILLEMTILMSTLAQGSFANSPPQGMQSGDKDTNDPHIKGCPTRLLGDSHNGANETISNRDAKTGCPRRQPSYHISDNMTAPSMLDASLEQSSCQILIFVSFSMPEASLKSLAQETARDQRNPCRPVLVMRGLYQDGFLKTAEKLKDLGVSVDINPELFETHQVTTVPTFIFVKDGLPLHRLKGNVTLAFSKERFALEDQAPGVMHASAEPGK